MQERELESLLADAGFAKAKSCYYHPGGHRAAYDFRDKSVWVRDLRCTQVIPNGKPYHGKVEGDVVLTDGENVELYVITGMLYGDMAHWKHLAEHNALLKVAMHQRGEAFKDDFIIRIDGFEARGVLAFSDAAIRK